MSLENHLVCSPLPFLSPPLRQAQGPGGGLGRGSPGFAPALRTATFPETPLPCPPADLVL